MGTSITTNYSTAAKSSKEGRRKRKTEAEKLNEEKDHFCSHGKHPWNALSSPTKKNKNIPQAWSDEKESNTEVEHSELLSFFEIQTKSVLERFNRADRKDIISLLRSVGAKVPKTEDMAKFRKEAARRLSSYQLQKCQR